MSMPRVDYRLEHDIAVLIVNNPPVNALSTVVSGALLDLLRTTDADPEVKGVVLIGAGNTFVAGADIREFGMNLDWTSGRAPFDAIESSKKPIIAALHGTAFGAGLELALAAHYRVALRSAKVGLPEVLVGVLPGAGGTQRLPRLVGVEISLDLITNGTPIDSTQALRYGIVDYLIEGGDFDALLRGALAFSREIVAERRPLKRVRDLDAKISAIDPAVFGRYREANAKKWKGVVAPWKIVDCIEAACAKSWEEGYRFEQQCFAECQDSPQRAALSYIFFATRQAAKITGVPPGMKAHTVKSVAIIGAGTMGSGIAMAFANSGITVKQLEVGSDALKRGWGIIKKNYDASVARGSMTRSMADEAMSRISGTVSYEGICACDIVIEAVFEDMNLKKEIFSKLDMVMKPGAILATNTSTLDIDQIASATQRPEAVVGTHFFSPANVMKLIECVRGRKSSSQTLITAMGLAKQIGKVAVLAGNCDGFIGNRILEAYGRQADFLLEEGATPWQVDEALKAFGLPMGIYLMRDMAGLDVAWRVRQHREPLRDKSLRYSPVADRICELGRFGQKTGAGYYTYDGRVATPDPAIEHLIVEVSKQLSIERKQISDQEIVNRILIAMVNEGARIVGEGYAARASDIDVTYVHGYGFPRYEGGPMFWAERRGLAKIYEQVLAYQKDLGADWTPAPLLEKAAAAGAWTVAQGA
jgi:3-hydroxyacyl-CoA dehydrogenase